MQADHFTDRLTHDAPDFIVLAPGYPSATSNGGEFIRTRVRGYLAAGLTGHVFDYRSPAGSAPHTQWDGTLPITVLGPDLVSQIVERARVLHIPVLAHSPSPEISRLLHAELPGKQLAVWYHGYEVRDYRRLMCNYTTADLAISRSSLDRLNHERFAAAGPIFGDSTIVKVFVSDFQRRYSEWDVGVAPRNSLIIPNFIDTDYYQARVREPAEVKNILLLRSFGTRNYANDIALRALELLSNRRGFSDLSITVRGFGVHFENEVRQVRKLPNVSVTNAYSSPAEMAILHYDHGVFLCPSRFDTQGVMLGEAMASGMVTITNPVAAIPEYTDEASSLLPRPDDPWAFADALWHLVSNPALLPRMSRAASARVAHQCGREATIDREISLIEGLRA